MSHLKVCDATNLDYLDGQFDISFSGGCILHIADYKKAISETIRVSKNFVIFHRVPVYHMEKTRFYVKKAYGVKVLEIVFNEEKLSDLFRKYKISILKINTHLTYQIFKSGETIFTKSYLCKKI